MQAVDNLADKFVKKGGEIITLRDGSLLNFGLAVFQCEGLHTAIIREQYLNEWSSAYSVKQYKTLPKKYADMIENL